MKRKGASGSPWRTPVSILKTSVFPSGVMTRAEVFSYITLIAATISGGIPYEERIFNIFFLPIESNAFLKSMKVITASFLWFCSSSIILLRARRCEVVDPPGRKPFQKFTRRKSNGVRIDHEKKSDGVRVHHKKERWGES